MGNLIPTDKKRSIIACRAAGHSYATIAKEMGVAKQTAVDICKENEEAVATLRALELEELYEQQHVTTTERIKAHVEVLNAICKELKKRSFISVPTEKLVDLYLKTQAAIKDEIIPPHFQTEREQERDRQERGIIEALGSM